MSQGWEKCECGGSHHISVRLPHDTHIKLKEAAKQSSSKSMGAFVANLILRALGDVEVQKQPQLRRRIKVKLSDLQNARMADLRKFANNHGIDASRKREIIDEIRRTPHIALAEDVKESTVTCSCCLQKGHNIATCPHKWLLAPVNS